MAVVVVTTGVAATGNPGTSLVIAPSDPSAIQPGDLILVAVRQSPPNNGDYSDMAISGFTVMATVDFPDIGGTAWMRQRLLGKVATASEPSSYTITNIDANSYGVIAHLVALRGVDLTGGLPSNIVTATNTAASRSITIPAITIQQAGSLDIVFVSNSGNEENPIGLTDWGGGFTELLDTALDGNWMLGGVAIATRATAGVQPETSVEPVGDAQWGTAIRLEIPAAPAGGGGEISGSSALTISGAGTLTGAGELAGTTGLAFAASAALNGAGELAGSGTLAFSTGAALKGAGALSGATGLAFAASAALKGAGELAGSTASAFSASAVLRGSGALSGAAALVFGASGSMAQGAISGSSQNIFSALGTLIGDGALSAAGGFAFVPTGTLSATVSISGSSALGFSVSGTLFDVAAIHTPRSRTRVVHKVDRHALIVKTDRSALVKRRGRLH